MFHGPANAPLGTPKGFRLGRSLRFPLWVWLPARPAGQPALESDGSDGAIPLDSRRRLTDPSHGFMTTAIRALRMESGTGRVEITAGPTICPYRQAQPGRTFRGSESAQPARGTLRSECAVPAVFYVSKKMLSESPAPCPKSCGCSLYQLGHGPPFKQQYLSPRGGPRLPSSRAAPPGVAGTCRGRLSRTTGPAHHWGLG